jgi:hypothetical protein
MTDLTDMLRPGHRAVFRNAPDEGAAGGDTAATETTETTGEATQKTDGADAAGTGPEPLLGGRKPDAGETSESTGEEGTETTEAAADADPLDVVPEDGTYQFDLPEGVEVDEALVGAISPVFKDLGLTVKAANTLAGVYAQHQAAQAEAYQTQVRETLESWVAEAKADPAYKADGFEAAKVHAGRALEQFGDEDIVAVLEASNMSYNPHIHRLLYRVGKAMAEDTTLRNTGQGAGSEAPVEERLYGATTPTTKRA